MAAGDFLTDDEERRIAEQISAIAHRTTGEIHVHITRRVSRHGVMADARKVFRKLHLDHSKHRNAVLIFIASDDRQLACLGDDAIHQKLGEASWERLVANIVARFKQGDHYLGLHGAIDQVGDALAAHFPRASAAAPRRA